MSPGNASVARPTGSTVTPSAVARPMPAVIADAQALPPTPSATPPDNGTGNPKARYGDGITSQISTTMERIWGLTAALTVNTQTGLTGDQYTAPLREDMLRALTQSVPPSVREALAQQRITTTQRTMTDLFHGVKIGRASCRERVSSPV